MTEDNFNRLKEHFSPLHITLVEKYFQKFLEISEKIELDENDILHFLKSEKLTIDNKFNFIEKIERFIEENKKIAKIVGKIILEKNQIVEFDYNAIKNIVESLTEITEKINIILLLFSDRFSDDELIDIISSIDSDYAKIFEERKRPVFKYTKELDKLVNILKSKSLIKNVITNIEKNEIKIIANE